VSCRSRTRRYVVLDSFLGQFNCALRFVPAGDYTLALTCNGNDDVVFRGLQNVRVAAGGVLPLDSD
jgi:hypothetical protein